MGITARRQRLGGKRVDVQKVIWDGQMAGHRRWVYGIYRMDERKEEQDGWDRRMEGDMGWT